MKRFLTCIALVGLIALTSCGGDSPTAKPVPTVVPAEWSVSLVADPTSTFVDTVVTVTANVSVGGSAAPDGTIVYFTVSGTEIAQKTTEGGVAVTGFTASEAGTYSVVARAHDVQRAIGVTFTERSTSETLEIYQVLPNEGAFDGGEQVILRGKGIAAPAAVVFSVGSAEYSAEVVSVQESVPLSGQGQITIRTPYIGGVERASGQTADIQVTTGEGTSNQQVFLLSGGFTLLAEQELHVFQALDPHSGPYEGGDTVVLTGRGIRAPARVTFIMRENPDAQDFAGGTEFPAIVQSVTESVPASAEGQIVIETPFIPEDERPIDPIMGLLSNHVDVRVEVDIDTSEVLSQELPAAFTYVPQGSTVPEIWRLEQPSMYLIVEAYGSSQGGETVTILGRNFRARKFGNDGVTIVDTEPAVTSVIFADGLEAQILSVSEDGTQIEVLTPRFTAGPFLDEDSFVSVEVTTQFDLAVDPGPYTVELNNSFVYLADLPTPEITSISPIAGPLDGGTLVTLQGHGFQFPVQVLFGNLAAEEVNLIDDQTLSDNDVITCLAPDYSQQNEVPPIEVDVTVLNTESGKDSNAVNFTYGDNLYITSNTPTEGRPGDTVIIYGSGFEDPLEVDYTGVSPALRLEVISVSGTQLLVKFPDDADPVCFDTTGTFVVTLIERLNDPDLGETEGGRFTYLGNTPIVTNVDPTFVQSASGGDAVLPAEVTISGLRFADNLFVDIETYRMQNADITVVDDQTIDLFNLPAPNDFNLTWETGACITDAGLQGVRDVPTPVDVTVTNFPGECADTLVGAIIYEPEDDTCVVAPSILVTPPLFPDTPAGTCSAGGTLTIQNQGEGTLEVQSVALQGQFFFDNVYPPSSQLSGAITVPPFSADSSLTVYFCPDVDDGSTYTGQAVIVSNDPNSPTNIALSGTELSQALIATSPFGNGDTWTFPTTPAGNCSADQVLTVSNSGDADLQISSVSSTNTTDFQIISSPTTVPQGGGTADIVVQFCPAVDDNTLKTGTLSIASNAGNLPNVQISLEGQEQP